MLKIKKVLFDADGDIKMRFKHLDYDIKLSSTKDFNCKRAILSSYGIFLEAKSWHSDFSNTKAFKDRCYKPSDLPDVTFNSKWFIRHADTTREKLEEFLMQSNYLYELRATFSKFGVGLANHRYDASSYIKAYNTSPKGHLIDVINSLLESAFQDAERNNSRIFSRRITLDTRRPRL